MKHKVPIGLLFLLLGTYSLFSQSQNKPKPTVEVMPLKEATLFDKTYYGARLEPKNITVIMTPFEGTIVQILASEGQMVKNGSPLFSIVRTSQASTGDYVPLIVRATVSGVVMTIPIKVADEVANKTEAVVIANVSSLKAQILVSDKDLKSLKVGMTCTAPGGDVGKIQKIALLPDTKSGLFPVEIGFAPSPELYTGLFVKIEIAINPLDGIFIPGNTIVSRYGKKYAYIIRDNRAEMQEIEVLKMVGPNALVSGLKAGEMLAITNLRMLSADIEVTAVPAQTIPAGLQ